MLRLLHLEVDSYTFGGYAPIREGDPLTEGSPLCGGALLCLKLEEKLTCS